MLLFRAARWDHWTFQRQIDRRGSSEGKDTLVGMGEEEGDTTREQDHKHRRQTVIGYGSFRKHKNGWSSHATNMKS